MITHNMFSGMLLISTHNITFEETYRKISCFSLKEGPYLSLVGSTNPPDGQRGTKSAKSDLHFR